MNNSNSRKVEGKFSNKDVFFTFWFYLINLYFSRPDICKDNQSKIIKKKAKNTGTVGVNESGTGKVDIKKNSGTGGVDKSEDSGKSGGEKSSTGKVD